MNLQATVQRRISLKVDELIKELISEQMHIPKDATIVYTGPADLRGDRETCNLFRDGVITIEWEVQETIR